MDSKDVFNFKYLSCINQSKTKLLPSIQVTRAVQSYSNTRLFNSLLNVKLGNYLFEVVKEPVATNLLKSLNAIYGNCNVQYHE